MKNPTTIIACSIAAALTPVWGAVSLPITRLPVVGPPHTGPIFDDNADQGQWFEHSDVRSHEFYDNIPNNGGGSSSSLAISGFATNIIYVSGQGSGIVSFDITATITNDLGTETGPWADGSNSHGESLSTPNNYVGTMYQTMMTIEFALTDLTNQPASWNPPYTQQTPEIYAINEDDSAWYCYNANELPPQNQGSFYVPAWNFGDIALTQSASRILSFNINGQLLPGDPRYEAIVSDLDILSNRTTSLKISNWVDTIDIDPGGAYDPPSQLHSNASVFHEVPEPSIASILGLAGLALIFRRRK